MKNSECNTCPSFYTLCAQLNQLPYYKEIKIPKAIMQKIPRCFEETILGEPRGALRQFRGPNETHVLEYKKEWVLHRDRVDQRFDPVGHLVNDAPYVLMFGFFAGLVLFAIALAIGGEKD